MSGTLLSYGAKKRQCRTGYDRLLLIKTSLAMRFCTSAWLSLQSPDQCDHRDRFPGELLLMRTLQFFTVLILMSAPIVQAQDFWSAADLDDLSNGLSSRVGSNNAAILNNIINEGGYYAAMVHREAGPGFSELHDEWADIYFVTNGSATIFTGGSIVDVTESSPGEFRGSSIEGGVSRPISAGEIVHIPAGLPHYVLVGE